MQDTTTLQEKELDTILKFSALVNSSLDIEDVLNHAMRWAEEFMNAEASTIYELDPKKQELFVRIARGKKTEPIKNIRIKLGEGIAGRVVQTGKPMVVHDVTKEDSFDDKFDKITHFTTRSILCVPLQIKGKTIGAIQALNKKADEQFNDSDLELLTSMSQQIAVALDNAKLYARLQEKFHMTTQELRITQEKLIRSKRLEAMGHLAQGVAHEIRNPVTTIGGFARRIKQAVKGDFRLYRYISIILDESERLESLVKEVNEFSRLLKPTFKLDNISKVISHVSEKFRPLANKNGIDVQIHLDQGLPLIKMDASQLTTAFSNILENALEAMPDGGELRIDARLEGKSILIRISDTGKGISQNDLDSIYDPFYTSKTRGAGLGLTMVHQIVINHEGEIKSKSEESLGTTLTIRFPVKH
jgi:signal transduction histidine kinase